MKFRQLQVGARFMFEGREYVKEGPVAARDAQTGKSRMIPRYAVLSPVDELPAAGAKAEPTMVPRETVLAAFDEFYAECAACAGPETEPRLAAARVRFLSAI
jgi:hypothetical protein